MGSMTYDATDDTITIALTGNPVVRSVSVGWSVNIGYDLDDKVAQIKIIDAVTLGYWPPEQIMGDSGKDEQPIWLTQRESLRLLEMLENPLPRSLKLLMGLARNAVMNFCAGTSIEQTRQDAITEVISTLLEVWVKHPDMTLGQLVLAAIGHPDECPTLSSQDDASLAKALRALDEKAP